MITRIQSKKHHTINFSLDLEIWQGQKWEAAEWEELMAVICLEIRNKMALQMLSNNYFHFQWLHIPPI